MEKLVTSSFRLGILGGGQLGRMLALAAAHWDIRVYCMDESEHAPAVNFCHDFQKGSIDSFDHVVSFAEHVDMLTIESDHVNADALAFLEGKGKKVYPASRTLRIIQDKGEQRRFCLERGFPVPAFRLFSTKDELSKDVAAQAWVFPFIVKKRSAGYDGKGVFLVKNHADLEKVPVADLLAEQAIDIHKELSVIAVRNSAGEIRSFTPVELVMHPDAYLVDYLISPADIPETVINKSTEMARALIDAFDIKGLLAIEMFLDRQGNIWINECSPRPHNSGHHTIESAFTCQYEQHLRAILGLPLGSTETKMPAAMINLLGDIDSSGLARYEGLTDCLKIEGVKVHIYGKKETRPRRKMGHITILNPSREKLDGMVEQIKNKVKVKAWDEKRILK